MGAGDNYAVENDLFLQLGEPDNRGEAPFTVFLKNKFEQTKYCDEKYARYYFAKGDIHGIIDDYYYINLASDAIAAMPLDTFRPDEIIATISEMRIDAIRKCAKDRGSLIKAFDS